VSEARASALYVGRVTHARHIPRKHRLSYRVWYLLLDLDEIEELDRDLPGFAAERPGPVSFRAADHGPGDGTPLRPWVEHHLARAGIDLEGGPIRILTFPRVLGYVFNPIAVWFCHDRDGRLRAVLYEVTNTFGERHSYLAPVVSDSEPSERVRHVFDKELFVSPFIDMEARYDFTTRVPGERVSLAVRETVREGPVLDAALVADRVSLTGRSLLSAFVRTPLLTMKVIAGIHWEAVKLWGKGAPYRRRGAPPADEVTVLTPSRPTVETAA
jgi:DUF1365 family protein